MNFEFSACGYAYAYAESGLVSILWYKANWDLGKEPALSI